jgi:hypothetical protein
MDHQRVVEALEQAATSLTAERVSEIDFAKLQGDLITAVALIGGLIERGKIADRLVNLLKNELAGKAKAIARLQGRTRHVAESLLGSEGTTMSELLTLREQIEEEFDSVFSQKLRGSTASSKAGEKQVDSATQC